MKLMNCTRCDDVVKLVDKIRFCECGMCQGVAGEDGSVDVGGAARVLTIAWETYDGLAEGVTGEIGVLPRAQAKGGV
jgi:hypothetical protein